MQTIKRKRPGNHTYYRTDEDQQEKSVPGYKKVGQTFENTQKKHNECLPFASPPTATHQCSIPAAELGRHL